MLHSEGQRVGGIEGGEEEARLTDGDLPRRGRKGEDRPVSLREIPQSGALDSVPSFLLELSDPWHLGEPGERSALPRSDSSPGAIRCR